jgi:hypothetical protein
MRTMRNGQYQVSFPRQWIRYMDTFFGLSGLRAVVAVCRWRILRVGGAKAIEHPDPLHTVIDLDGQEWRAVFAASELPDMR